MIEHDVELTSFGRAVAAPHACVCDEPRLAKARTDRDTARELLQVARRYLGAGEHDCTGPEDCWTCAVDAFLEEDS